MSMVKLTVAAVLSMAVAMPASQAFAQKKPSKREAAMEKCLASVQGPDMKDRIAQYSACMKKEGQRP